MKRGSIKHDLLALWAVATAYGPILLGMALFFAAPSIWTFLLSVVITGARQHALSVLAHESWHWTLFRRRSWNDFFGAWLFSYPLVTRYDTMRQKHFDHHRRLGELDDPDRYYWGWPGDGRGAFILHHLVVASGAGFVFHTARGLLGIAPRAVAPEARPVALLLKPTPNARRELVQVALVQLALLAAFALTVGWFWYFALWLLPFVTFASLLGELRQFLEHRHGELMIYRASPIERFFFSPYNFHLHAIHHTFASEPWFKLPELEANAFAKVPEIRVCRSYVVELVRYLRAGAPAHADRGQPAT